MKQYRYETKFNVYPFTTESKNGLLDVAPALLESVARRAFGETVFCDERHFLRRHFLVRQREQERLDVVGQRDDGRVDVVVRLPVEMKWNVTETVN